MDDASRTPTDITLMDACALSDAIRARKVSCVEVMTAFLDRIERLNPKVNAIVSLQDRGRSLAEARERDDELARGEHRGWMHGFPQAIKDLAPADGFRATKGSPLFGDVPKEDGIFVERMRRAGAIVIGKTNTPEFGLGSQTYNPVFGPTLNAYDQAKTAGGSSGGAAVALALRMLPVADGSDHGGSLRNPAAFNNVFGFRPSYGRVPANAEEVFLPQLSVAGPMARTVPDLARLLSVQAGYDARLPLSIDEDPAVFAEPLKRDVKGAAACLVRRLRRPPADGARHPRSLPCGAEGLRGHGLHRRGGRARFRSGADLAGLAAVAPLADRRAAPRVLPRSREARQDEARGAMGDRRGAEALGLRHRQGLGPCAAPGTRRSGACSSATTIGSCRRRRCSPSTLRPTGRRRSPAAGWTPITAGWRW